MNNPSFLRVWGLLGGLIFTLSSPAQSLDQLHGGNTAKTYAFINGQWFDGQRFSKTTWYSHNGAFTRSKPESIEKTLDLEGGYVVPPFGEAHTHNVEGEWNINQVIQHYVRDGIFYVKNPNDISEFVEQIRHKLNNPETIDVVFAHAGLTGQNGHPISLYEDILRIHRYEPVVGKRDKGWFQGRAYFPISTLRDFEDYWPIISATKPDFLKVYLAESENFRNADHFTKNGFRKGLNPRLIDPIVTFAHQKGLRVTAHIETAADFRTALTGGVDEIAHIPGWFLPDPSQSNAVLLTPEDATLTAKHQTVVVTTTVAGHFHTPGHAHPISDEQSLAPASSHGHKPSRARSLRDVIREIQIKNLQLLHQAGVKLAIGSDHAETALAEALHLHELGIFDNLTLLKMWCETTAHTIFPSRKIGQIDDGYEASFLVLQNNPLEDFRHVQTITYRFKQGVPLSWDDMSHTHANAKKLH